MFSRSIPVVAVLTVIFAFGVLASSSSGQAARGEQPLGLPASATLEGMPTVRVESSEQGTSRQLLGKTEGEEHPLRLRLKEGAFYPATEDTPLQLRESDGFVYLTSKPGSYIRLRRVSDRISYVEHVDQGLRSVTYWGEIRIALGK